MSYTKTQWNNDTAPAINETNLNKIEQGIYDNDSHIGDLTTLTTTADTDLVSAINEVDSHSDTNATNIGDLSSLTTTADTDLVSAINELDNLKATKDVATTSANGLMSSSDKAKLDNIIESGSNANGRYIKYEDGTMICSKIVTTSKTISTGWGNFYIHGYSAIALGNYAQTFIETPMVTFTLTASNGAWAMCASTGSESSFPSVTLVTGNAITAENTFYINAMAIGRWK